MKDAFTPFLHLSTPPKTNKFIMAGKMANLLALVVSLVGLAIAQTQTTPVDGTVSMEITSAMDTTATMDTMASDGTATDVTESVTTSDADESTSTSEIITTGYEYGNQTVRTREWTGLPTTTIPNPFHNAARRPSEPGLKKLSVVVGLVTYGLILL